MKLVLGILRSQAAPQRPQPKKVFEDKMRSLFILELCKVQMCDEAGGDRSGSYP